eukprot:jgi/Botrbrau1/12341/Bobra.4_3s0013.1
MLSASSGWCPRFGSIWANCPSLFTLRSEISVTFISSLLQTGIGSWVFTLQVMSEQQ